MTLNKYTVFTPKKNAEYYGDPNGSYIMAEDINLIQDSVNQIESVIGIHDNKSSLSERIAEIEKHNALSNHQFIVYKGNPLTAYADPDEAIHYFSLLDSLVLVRDEDANFDYILTEIKKGGTSVYGYIDAISTNSLAAIQLDIEWWRSKGASGIFLANFDYAFGNTRKRQNDILLSVNERNLKAVVTGNPSTILFNAEDPQNPEWEPLDFDYVDGYYTQNLFVQNGNKVPYDSVLLKAKDLIRAKNELGINIFVEDTANGAANVTQQLYEHGHSLSLLFGLDSFFLSRTDAYALNDPLRFHSWAPFLGSWDNEGVSLFETVSDIRKRTRFGEIIYMKASNMVVYTGLTIPANLFTWTDNSIPGTAIQDNTIEDKKIKNYNGDRLLDAINDPATTKLLDFDRIEKFGLNQLDGDVKVSSLTANVINAIEANIGKAYIDSAIIGELTAGHISANVIEAINIAAGHIEAGSAYIHGAIIDKLNAGSIVAGDIEAERITAGVIHAINLHAGTATIDTAVIGELKADNIQAAVVAAINLYAESAVIDKAKINSAIIGDLTASHIEAVVIDAIEANIGKAVIDSAIIGELTADHIETAVIDAINANIGHAVIDTAVLGELSANQIKSIVVEAINLKATNAVIDSAKIGVLTSDHMKAGVMEALRANIGIATIDNALIGELEAGHIKAQVIDAINANIGEAKIDAARIKELTADHIKASVIDALKANIGLATIDSALIGTLKADSMSANILDALKAHIGTATIDNALIGELEADHIQTNVIEAINANIGHATIGGAIIQDGTIMDSKIFELQASKITSGTIDTSKVTISGMDGHLVIDDNSLEIYDATDSNGMRRKRVILGKADMLGDDVYGLVVMGADGQTRLFDHTGVYNEGIHNNAISNTKLQEDSVDARVLKANSVFAEHIMAGEVTAEKIGVNQVQATHIEAGAITSDKIFAGGNLQSVSNNKPVTITGGTLANLGPTSRAIDLGLWTAVINQSMTVDLGKVYKEIHEVSFTTDSIQTNTFSPRDYKIEYSVDNTAWATLISEKDNVKTWMSHKLLIPSARYIRLTILKAQANQTTVKIANFEAKTLSGGTVISGDTIRTGTIDADLVDVKNLKAEMITVGSGSKFEDGYDPFEIWGYAQNLSTKGLAVKADYSSFTTPATGKLYMHGFDSTGQAADVNGYLLVNGQNMTVPKGVIDPGAEMKGYIMFDVQVNRWYICSMKDDMTWRRYNVGASDHGQLFIPNINCYFVGQIEP